MQQQSLPSQPLTPLPAPPFPGGLSSPVNVRSLPNDRLRVPFARAPSTSTSGTDSGEVDPAEVQRLVTVLGGFDESALDAYISAAKRRGLGPARILVDLVAPAARQIGEAWEEDRWDFVDVTLASGRLKRIVRELGALLVHPDARAEAQEAASPPLALLSSPVGQGHTLGLLMVAEFLHADRWSVCLGAPFERLTNSDFVASRFTHLVGLSLSDTDHFEPVREEIRRLRRRSRNPTLRVLVGGPALGLRPELVELVEADAGASDARLVPELARSLL